MSQSLRTAAQNYIRGLFIQGRFPAVGYDRGGARILPEPVSAATCEINEESSSFVVDKSNGMEVSIKPAGWTLDALVTFNAEVDLHEIAMSVFGKQILVPKTTDYPPFRITLVRYKAQHPARKEPNGGTKAVFTLQIKTIRGR